MQDRIGGVSPVKRPLILWLKNSGPKADKERVTGEFTIESLPKINFQKSTVWRGAKLLAPGMFLVFSFQNCSSQFASSAGLNNQASLASTAAATAAGTTTMDATTLRGLILAAGGKAQRIAIPKSITVDSSLDVPANIQLDIAPGAIINVISPAVLTIATAPVDSLFQLFSGSGTVQLTTAMVVRPEWWGALGNRTNDDTLAIQAAINSLSITAGAMGGVIKLRPVTYLITNTIEITHGAIGIQGDIPAWLGEAGSSFLSTRKNATALWIHAPTDQMNNNYIRDLSIIINDDTSTSGAGIQVTNTVRTTITDVKTVGFSVGLLYQHVIDAVVTRYAHHMLFNANGTAYGIVLDASTFNASNTFRDVIVSFPRPHTGFAFGFYTAGATVNDIFLENFEADQCDTCIYIDASGSIKYDVKIEKPVLDSYYTNGIELHGFSGDGAVTINNGWMAPTASKGTITGVKTMNASGIKVLGVEFNGLANPGLASQYGILALGCSDCIFSNNSFRNLNQGIGAAPMNASTINGNSFLNNNTANAAASFLQLTAGSTYNTVTGNTFNGYATTGVVLDASSIKNTVNANTFVPTGITTAIVNSGGSTNSISNNTN